MEFKYIVFIICTILLLLLFLKEIKRNNKTNLSLRIVASIFMVISFAFLIAPLTYQTVNEQSVNELNIITAGTNTDSIAKIKGEKFDLDSSLFSDKKRLKIKHIEDLGYYLQENKDIKKVNIFGYGLDEAQLNQLHDYQISFHPATIPSGVISASWQNKIKETENLNVQGVYNNISDEDIKLKLFGLGANLDSIIVKANSKSNFSFNNQPKLAGKAIYKLIGLKGKDTLTADPIPFEVEGKQPIQILILASFPDFEYKFLKNWLYEKQYQVIFRSQISRDKFSSDFLNTKAVNVSSINQALLKQTEVLLIDEDEMSAISVGEKTAINAAVSNGMGLIIRVTNAKPNTNSPKYGRYEVSGAAATAISIDGVDKDIKLSELPFPQTLFLETTPSEQSLFRSVAGKSVVNIQLDGMGKILINSLASTYQWVLAGKQTDYALFWSTLFSKASRKEYRGESFEFSPQFLNIGSNASLLVNLSGSKVPSLAFNDIKLNPKQNIELPFKWEATFWPTITGWNNLTINGLAEHVFVYQPYDWLTLKNTIKINLNIDFSTHQLHKRSALKLTTEEVTQEISKWWFYIIFLLAGAYLWYEQRFLAN